MWNKRPSEKQGSSNDDDDDNDRDDVSHPPSPTDDTALLVPTPGRRPPSSTTTPSPPARYYTFPVSPDTPPKHPGTDSSSGYPPPPPPPTATTTPGGEVLAGGSPSRRGRHPLLVYVLACFAALSGLLFGYDTGIISGSMLLIRPHLNLTTLWVESIVSATIAAAAVSALVSGAACDRAGRRKVIMAASVVFTGGAVLMGVAPDKESLLGGRVVVGVGIGFASTAVPVYIAESSPPDIRGLLVTLNQLFITVGILVSSIVAGAFSGLKTTGWRYMLGLAAVPGVVQFCGFLFLPDSPRWLLSKGREEEARRVLRCTRGTDDVEDEIKEIQEAEAKKQTGFVVGQMLKTSHVRRALLVGCGVQLFQQLCGINTVIYYSGTILKEAGFHVSQAVWLVTIPFAVNFLATFIGMATVDRYGRRVLLVVSFVGVTGALVVLSTSFLLSELFSPPVNTSLPVLYPNGSLVTDSCQGFTLCEDCISADHCGYCYEPSQSGLATCLLARHEDEDNSAAYGRCSNSNSSDSGQGHPEWAFGFCPTGYGWMAVLGLALFVLSFAPGLGPLPWTINAEIYPTWARGTGVALATMVNWACNLLVSFTFLTLSNTITKYGLTKRVGLRCWSGICLAQMWCSVYGFVRTQ
ncbi:proton myo-inositol cotransporter-like isoform X2 [Babylonia areolata]|uniref:proton myo-inositol cotransporter-like isoform X2 n=1 Tax=Babylonia areolata TaxID=304850 RepID=UPI003FD18095